MKITKLCHSCLLVEMPEPVNRTALFDPGIFSEDYVNIDSLVYLDDIIITHQHPDHMSVQLVQRLLEKFPEVRITAPADAVAELKRADIFAMTEEFDGVKFFDSPHEGKPPFLAPPQQLGVHYLDRLTHPGDSHSFKETKQILALPVQAPWGSTARAVELALQLKPRYVLPIHDWHWNDEARRQMYGRLEQLFGGHDSTFLPLVNGEPVVIDTSHI